MTRRHILLALRYSSGIGGAPAGDMFVASVSKSAWHAVGEQIGSLIAAVYKTFSETGQVKLASRDWRDEPIVEFNLLSDRRDLERLMDGFRRLGAMQLSAALQQATSDPFPASYTDKVRQVGVVNAKNKRITDVIAKLLDGPAWLRRKMIEKLDHRGLPLRRLDARRRGAGRLHPQGRDRGVACVLHLPHGRRGRSDGGDRHPGRVRGVDGLRVVDASLFPAVPCANTNFPALMTAEKIATRCWRIDRRLDHRERCRRRFRARRPLPAPRENLHARHRGRFQRIRLYSGWPLLLGYFGLPWLDWGGRQAVLFDLPSRALLRLRP